MKKVLISIAALLVTLLCYTACSPGNSSLRPLMVGVWGLNQYGLDGNGNGIWDASEKHTATSMSVFDTLTLKDDSTGIYHQAYSSTRDTSYPITWTLSNDNYLTISGAGYTFRQYVQSIGLSSVTFRFTDTSYGVILTEWSEYSKQ